MQGILMKPSCCCRVTQTQPEAHARTKLSGWSCSMQPTRREQRSHICRADVTRELAVLQPAQAPAVAELCPSYCYGMIAGAAIVVAAASAYAYKVLMKESKQNLQAEYGSSLYPPPNPEKDPEGYQLALARSRQSWAIQKAVVNMKAGEPARAIVELGRAMHENAICRTPLNCGHTCRSELMDLYRLHLKYTEVPPSFAHLLQLREMLGITKAEAERLEQEVFATGEAFAI